MKTWPILFILTACATPTPPQVKEEDQVSIDVALEHIGQSYTLGCAEALKARGESNFYPVCRQRGMKHQEDVKAIINSP